MSTYSVRAALQSGKFSWRDWAFLDEHFPGVQGLELLDDHIIRQCGDYEVKKVQPFLDALAATGREAFAVTVGVPEMGNQVPFWHGYDEFLAGFEQVLEYRVGSIMDWVEFTGELGIRMMRVDVGPVVMNHVIQYSRVFDFNIDLLSRFYGQVCDAAEEAGIKVSFENHGWFASDATVMRALLAAEPRLMVCLDLGNFPGNVREANVREFAPRTLFVHAKTYVFDEAGEERYMNYRQMLQDLKAAGFDGWLSVEFEGPGSEIEGVKNTVALLEKYR
jgi:sugar phosphate isomerase/epimerase